MMTPEIIIEIAQILYRNWAEKDKNYRTVTEEKDDGSPDWKLFHNTRMNNALNAKLEAYALYDAFKKHHREVFNLL